VARQELLGLPQIVRPIERVVAQRSAEHPLAVDADPEPQRAAVVRRIPERRLARELLHREGPHLTRRQHGVAGSDAEERQSEAVVLGRGPVREAAVESEVRYLVEVDRRALHHDLRQAHDVGLLRADHVRDAIEVRADLLTAREVESAAVEPALGGVERHDPHGAGGRSRRV
jgi:hypothetical protein